MSGIQKLELTPGSFVYSPPSPFEEYLPTSELAEKFWKRGQAALEAYGTFTRWGGLSLYVDELNYEQHGYWDMSSIYGGSRKLDQERLITAKTVAQHAKPGDVRYHLEDTNQVSPFGKLFYYEIWDEANPWCLPWAMRLAIDSYERAEKHVQKEWHTHKRLHDGVIDAFIWYRETGQAVKPTWTHENQLYGYDSQGKKWKKYTRCPGLDKLPVD